MWKKVLLVNLLAFSPSYLTKSTNANGNESNTGANKTTTDFVYLGNNGNELPILLLQAEQPEQDTFYINGEPYERLPVEQDGTLVDWSNKY